MKFSEKIKSMLILEEENLRKVFETEMLPKFQELNRKIFAINTIGNFYKLEELENILEKSKVFDISSSTVINNWDLKMFTFAKKEFTEKQINKELEKVKHLIEKTEEENTYRFIECMKWIKELFWIRTNLDHCYTYKNEEDEMILIYSTWNKWELKSVFEKFREIFSNREVFIDEEYFWKNSFTYLIHIKPVEVKNELVK